jgi:predicted anti-sigma-YlaC factor YlaD
MTTTVHDFSPEEVMAHHDGELTADRAREVAAHIENCNECRNLSAAFSATAQSLAVWTLREAPKSLQVTTERRARTAGQDSRSFFLALLHNRRLTLTLALAAATIFFVRFYSAGNYSTSRHAELSKATRVDISSYVPPRPAGAGGGGGGADREMMSQSLERSVDNATVNQSPMAPATATMIARTADLQIVVKQFDASRAALDAILLRHRGYAASLNIGNDDSTVHTLHASLRIPAEELSTTLAELKALGHVTTESQSGEEVTAEHADLVARLKNARETEVRLQDILRTRTGKVSDVLEVEQEIDRVRGEIEQMESELKNLNHRVDFATVTLTVTEEYQAKVADSTPGIATRLHNAAVDGLNNMRDSAVDVALWCAEFLPPLFFWLLILGGPVAIFWRVRRRAIAAATASPLT